MSDASPMPPVERVPAASPDLRLGRVEVFHTLALDLAELVEDPTRDRRILQRLRASDDLFGSLKEALIGRFPNCINESEKIRHRMNESIRLGGKAVWTDQFLERFAPIRLSVPAHVQSNEAQVAAKNRFSDNPTSPLHYVRFQAAWMKMFRDGTVTYSMRVTFENKPSHNAPTSSGTEGPASIRQAIERLEQLDRLLVVNFRDALCEFLRPKELRKAIYQSVAVEGEGLKLKDPARIDAEFLKRKVKEHRVIFVENFLDAPGEGLAKVPLPHVLKSSSLPGLLNTASWYEHYNARYVESLRRKEIGYREDEIYLTDRKATVVSAEGFWAEDPAGDRPADPLSRYKYDVVLAIEYNIACLAYFSSILAYFQEHPDVHGLENHKPSDALPHVIDGRSILSRIEESLDLSLLVDHGFTRVFIRRLREELGLDVAIGFIRRRVEDTSTSVGLKSSVLAAEHTSKDSLAAALKNNRIQGTLIKLGVAAVIVTLAVFAADKVWDRVAPADPFVVTCVETSEVEFRCADRAVGR